MGRSSAYNINAFGRYVARGYIVREDTGDVLSFQLNPSEVSDGHKANFVSIDSPGADYPEINFINQTQRSNVVTIKLDENLKMTVNNKRTLYVEDMIAKFVDLTKPTPAMVVMRSGSKKFVEPPTCRFVFGKRVVKCKVPEVKVKRTEFDKYLNAIVATIDIEILEVL